MILSDLIDQLRELPQDMIVSNGFDCAHSWRGSYYELSFEPCMDVCISEMLKEAEDSCDTYFKGWKGGIYWISPDTPVHLDYEGEFSDEDGVKMEDLIKDIINECRR